MSNLLINILVSMLIVLTTFSTARMSFLCALRWEHLWRCLASLPLVAFSLWIVVALLSFQAPDALPTYWSLELYGWALFSALYLYCLLALKAQRRNILEDTD